MGILHKLTEGLERRYIIYTLLSPAAMVGEVVMEVSIPMIMAKILDNGVSNQDVGYTIRIGLLMVGAALLSLCCGVLSARFAAVASAGFARNLRFRLFSKVQDMSFAGVDRFGTASLVTRLTTDVTNAQNTYQMAIRICVRAPVMLISATCMAFFVNSQLASLFLIIIPVLAVLLGIIGSRAFPRFRKMLTQYDKLNSTVQENLTGIRVVKSFVREDSESAKFEQTADELRRAQLAAEKIIIWNGPVMQLSMYTAIIAVLWSAGHMITAGSMQPGALVGFFSYITQILMSLMMLSMIFVLLVLARASIARIVEVLDWENDIREPESEHAVTQVADGSVEFKDVCFSYGGADSPDVLHDINISIPAGSTVGIMGGTGSAKSTLVQLIARLYDVKSGTVFVGGKDVRSYSFKTLRTAVAMVLQKNVLFSGTIRENLRWGNAKASDEEIYAACRAADAYDFVQSFPAGFDTELGQGGVNLSGGQKQRLCIARALLRKPQILILDDSTSAVDTATDRRIREALRSALPGTTKIIIAQRVTSVMDADIILVLDGGQIVARGTHTELLSSSSVYREVYESQQQGAN